VEFYLHPLIHLQFVVLKHRDSFFLQKHEREVASWIEPVSGFICERWCFKVDTDQVEQCYRTMSANKID
jgi:hypothetical protein